MRVVPGLPTRAEINCQDIARHTSGARVSKSKQQVDLTEGTQIAGGRGASWVVVHNAGRAHNQTIKAPPHGRSTSLASKIGLEPTRGNIHT